MPQNKYTAVRCENPLKHCRKPAKVWLWNPRNTELERVLGTLSVHERPTYYLVCGPCGSRLPRTTRLLNCA